jgi:hypothetical protein
MGQIQKCYVCNGIGLLVEGRIVVSTDHSDGQIAFISQCPRCKRFICTKHCEKLDLSDKGKKSFFLFRSRRPTTLTACCPFDAGVILGDKEL